MKSPCLKICSRLTNFVHMKLFFRVSCVPEGPEKPGNNLILGMNLEYLEINRNLEKNTEKPGILQKMISYTPKI